MPLPPRSGDYEEEGDATPSASTNHSTDNELSNADTPWDEFYGLEQYYGDCTNEFAYYNSNGPSESIPDSSFDPQSECAQDEIDAEDIAFAQEIRSRTTIDSSIHRFHSCHSSELILTVVFNLSFPRFATTLLRPLTSSNCSFLSRF